MKHWTNLLCADSNKLSGLGFSKMDFCIASPPYMPQGDQYNPLAGGNPARAGYAAYLRQMAGIYKQIGTMMKRGAHIVIVVDNVQKKSFTPLVRDISLAVSKHLQPVGETIVAWDKATSKNMPKTYQHTHCLVFRV